MYRLYSIRKDGFNEIIVTCVKKDLTKEEAISFKMVRMACPNRLCNYVIVAEANKERFLAEVTKMQEKLYCKDKKEQRWNQLKEAYEKGYKVTDAVKFLNR